MHFSWGEIAGIRNISFSEITKYGKSDGDHVISPAIPPGALGLKEGRPRKPPWIPYWPWISKALDFDLINLLGLGSGKYLESLESARKMVRHETCLHFIRVAGLLRTYQIQDRHPRLHYNTEVLTRDGWLEGPQLVPWGNKLYMRQSSHPLIFDLVPFRRILESHEFPTF